jgi:predicted amidohydrolase
MDCKIKDKKKNLKKVAELLDLIEPSTDFVCLPEFFSTGYNLDIIGNEYYNLAETIPGVTTDFLCNKAKEIKTAIIGSIIEKDGLEESVLYNTAVVISKNGDITGKYRKYNLYPTEYKYFHPGNEVKVMELDGLKIGLAICFDHAFPELFRILALDGAQVVFIPSAVPTGYEYLLDLRSMARAQDNQIFIVATNRVGHEDNISYCGLSKIVNPKGRVLSSASNNLEEIIYADIDLQEISEERKQEPVLKCLRQELLNKLSENYSKKN